MCLDEQADLRKDLLGTGCPMNLVYAKVAMAGLKTGQLLEIILDDGPPVRNVARSLQEEGHLIVSRRQRADTAWRLLVRKG